MNVLVPLTPPNVAVLDVQSHDAVITPKNTDLASDPQAGFMPSPPTTPVAQVVSVDVEGFPSLPSPFFSSTETPSGRGKENPNAHHSAVAPPTIKKTVPLRSSPSSVLNRTPSSQPTANHAASGRCCQGGGDEDNHTATLEQPDQTESPAAPLPTQHPCLRAFGECTFCGEGICKYTFFPYEACLRQLKRRCSRKRFKNTPTGTCPELHLTEEEEEYCYRLAVEGGAILAVAGAAGTKSKSKPPPPVSPIPLLADAENTGATTDYSALLPLAEPPSDPYPPVSLEEETTGAEETTPPPVVVAVAASTATPPAWSLNVSTIEAATPQTFLSPLPVLPPDDCCDLDDSSSNHQADVGDGFHTSIPSPGSEGGSIFEALEEVSAPSPPFEPPAATLEVEDRGILHRTGITGSGGDASAVSFPHDASSLALSVTNISTTTATTQEATGSPIPSPAWSTVNASRGRSTSPSPAAAEGVIGGRVALGILNRTEDGCEPRASSSTPRRATAAAVDSTPPSPQQRWQPLPPMAVVPPSPESPVSHSSEAVANKPPVSATDASARAVALPHSPPKRVTIIEASEAETDHLESHRSQPCDVSGSAVSDGGGGTNNVSIDGTNFIQETYHVAKEELKQRLRAKTNTNRCPFCVWPPQNASASLSDPEAPATSVSTEPGRKRTRRGQNGKRKAPRAPALAGPPFHTLADCPQLHARGSSGATTSAAHPPTKPHSMLDGCVVVVLDPGDRIIIFRPRSFPCSTCEPGAPHTHRVQVAGTHIPMPCPWGDLEFNANNVTFVDIEPQDPRFGHNPWMTDVAACRDGSQRPRLGQLRYSYVAFLLQRVTGIRMQDVMLLHSVEPSQILFPIPTHDDVHEQQHRLCEDFPVPGSAHIVAGDPPVLRRRMLPAPTLEAMATVASTPLSDRHHHPTGPKSHLYVLHALSSPTQYDRGVFDAITAAAYAAGVDPAVVSSPCPEHRSFAWCPLSLETQCDPNNLGMCIIRDTRLRIYDGIIYDQEAADDDDGPGDCLPVLSVIRAGVVSASMPGLYRAQRIFTPSTELLRWMHNWALHQETDTSLELVDASMTSEVPLPAPHPMIMASVTGHCNFCDRLVLARHQFALKHALFFYANINGLPLTTLRVKRDVGGELWAVSPLKAVLEDPVQHQYQQWLSSIEG